MCMRICNTVDMSNLIQIIEQYGLTKIEAKIYLAVLETGEASILDIAKKTGIKRTSIYYMLDHLVEKSILISVIRNKKKYYTAASPADLLKSLRSRLSEFEKTSEVLEQHKNKMFKRPRIYFLEGPSGFKQVWHMVFQSKPAEYRISTEGLNFLDFVKEKYVAEEIIKTKVKMGIKSFQIITDSTYARKIVAKDKHENRQSRILPLGTRLPFTEIICPKFVAYISPRFNNTIFMVEDEVFSEGRKIIFDLLWQRLTKEPNL